MTAFPEVVNLRQKPPFLFVERVESFDREQRCIVALLAGGDGRSFISSEHLPAYMLLEALAQVGGLLLRTVIGGARRGYVANLESVRFENPVLTESAAVRLLARFDEAMHPFYGLKISAYCGGQVLAEGKMRLYLEI